ncbi:MAG: hypothetical protein LBO78_03070 [Rickettsiales bacterium]|jgi:hypothetical protein|nr:hypothetical protein [Rickettsiales bacterium]
MDDAKKNADNLIESALNYNYAGFWDSLVTSFKTASRNRYSERQEIRLEAPKDNQQAAYDGIIRDCTQYFCTIIGRDWRVNAMFPSNVAAELSIELPKAEAAGFADAILRRGKTIKNSVTSDDYIEKDLLYYNNELISLRELLAKLNEMLANKEAYNIDKLKELDSFAASLNKRIMFMEADIEYLNDKKGKRLVRVKIGREYNSTYARVKANMQDILGAAADHLHWALLAVMLFILWKLFAMCRLAAAGACSGIAGAVRHRSINKLATKPAAKPTVVQQISESDKIPPIL